MIITKILLSKIPIYHRPWDNLNQNQFLQENKSFNLNRYALMIKYGQK